jgi:hypothetical protein
LLISENEFWGFSPEHAFAKMRVFIREDVIDFVRFCRQRGRLVRRRRLVRENYYYGCSGLRGSEVAVFWELSPRIL